MIGRFDELQEGTARAENLFNRAYFAGLSFDCFCTE
jgi:hypothetical protein